MAIFDPQTYYWVTISKDVTIDGIELKQGKRVKIAVLSSGDFLSIFNYPFFFSVYGSQIKYEFLKEHSIDLSPIWKEVTSVMEIKKA